MSRKRVRRRMTTAGVVLALALAAGCGAPAEGDGVDDGGAAPRTSSPSSPSPGAASPSGPPSPSASTSPVPARTLVEMTVTGGFAGVNDRLVVQNDGTYKTYKKAGPGRSGRMSPAELAALRRALEKADFAHLPREATGSPVADGFTYRITYEGHTVTTDETARLPALREVFAALPDH
ncbi:protealysin inhibitor emfourin [Streptomyces sp. CA-135486]|uniref:protealysin inhibitor emfourin n=1 Tax=Streptomyces sp. CA-135486 TaxID=3240049 RepID=UPI003D93125F